MMSNHTQTVFQEWVTPDSFLPQSVSEERQAVLSQPPYAEKKQIAGKTIIQWLPQNACDVADFLNLATQKKQAVSPDCCVALSCEDTAFLGLSKLNQVQGLHLADTAVTVGTGMCWGDLQSELAKADRWIPLSYPPDQTVLEIVANDLPALETGNALYPGGYPRDYILGVELATTDGRLSRYGGLVVKNATGYDLNKLYTGSGHCFGVLTAVTFKIFTKPKATLMLKIPIKDLEASEALIKSIQAERLSLQCFQIALNMRQPEAGFLLLELAGHYPDLLEVDKSCLQKRLSEHATAYDVIDSAHVWQLEPFSLYPDNRLIPDLRQNLTIEMAYNVKTPHDLPEYYWYQQLKAQLPDGNMPCWIVFSPMARLATLIWQSEVIARDYERTHLKAGLLALHQALRGDNADGLPEGFLRFQTFSQALGPALDFSLQQGAFFEKALRACFDPAGILTGRRV